MAQPAGIGPAISRDLKNVLKVVQVLVPILGNDDTDGTHTAGADLSGYEGAVLVANFGISGDTLSGSVKLIAKAMESDDNSTYTAVAAADLVGAFTLIDDAAEDPDIQIVGYIGSKRYVTVDFDFTGTHTNGIPISASVIKGFPRVLPAAQ